MRKEKALEYAMQACGTMIRRYRPEELPPEHKFHYHQGVFLSGMMHTWQVCGRKEYRDYIKAWADSIIWQDGSIHDFDPGMLDDIQPGILLFSLYAETGDSRYKTALDTLISILKKWKRSKYGGFWHKECHPNQMWLDGMYMAGPLEAEYAVVFGQPELLETAVEQVFLMAEYMTDKKTGLLYHGWDAERKMYWANPDTGLSQEFWGRAMGWYAVAVLDILEFTPKNHPKYEAMVSLERRVLQGVLSVQDKKSGMWYQVMDKGGCSDNWLETSCSALFAYAVAKAVHMDILKPDAMEKAWKAFDGIASLSLTREGDNLQVGGICVGTDVGNYEAYVTRPTCINDLHGMGAFLLMCAELAKE
ncbi:MAG: glycoside hydrolase family 88 protein [Clostridia bacterium]|nr:glycoside hydrolase family 88 protein [Clostridia bacterium]